MLRKVKKSLLKSKKVTESYSQIVKTVFFNSFTTEAPKPVSQWTGFYMIGTLVIKELKTNKLGLPEIIS